MRISHRHRFVFFSNPKTGSESVRALLDPFSDVVGVPYWKITRNNPFYSHISPAEVIALFRQFNWNYEEYYSFTFIRNPWARLVSLYGMIYFGNRGRLARAGQKLRSLAIGTPVHPSIDGFRMWLRAVRPDGIGGGGAADQRWQRYGTYSIRAYAFDAEERQLVKRIVRLEDIDRDLLSVLIAIGLPDATALSIPCVNTRPHTHYTDYYDDAAKNIVASNYSFDIERFGYRFGD